MEMNLLPDAEVSRDDVYISAHTNKDKTVQIPTIIEKLKEVQNLNPGSQGICVDDALSQSIGKDSRGRMRGLGGGICKDVVKRIGHMIKKNDNLIQNKVKKNMEIEQLKQDMKNVLATLDSMKAFMFLNEGGEKTGCSGSQPNLSSEASSPDSIHIGKQCDLFGWGHRVVARGDLVATDPMLVVHGSTMGEGNYKFALTEIVERDAELWKSDGFHKTIGEVGVGADVVWPKIFIEFI